MNSRDKVTREDRVKRKCTNHDLKRENNKDNIHVPNDLSIQYRIVNFLQVYLQLYLDM